MAPPPEGHVGYPFYNLDQRTFMETLKAKADKIGTMTGNDHSGNEIKNITDAATLGIITFKEATEGLRRL